MGRSDRIFFLVLAGAAWAYVIARAALVPLVHDECASLLWFVRSGEWLPYRAHWDANNHYLSSGIGVLLTRLFGEALITLRAGSVLAFMVYVWAAWRIGSQVHDRIVRASLWAALLWCPFMLDFFSLFRGYGIEMAGWLVALDGLLRYCASCSTRHMTQALSGALIAGAAIVALSPAWAILLVLLVAHLWKHRERGTRRTVLVQCTALVLLGLLPFLYATGVAMELKKLGLLYHGSTDGFFLVTVTSLCHYVLGSGSGWAALVVVLLVALSTAIGAVEVRRTKSLGSPLVLVNTVLWSDVLLRMLMATGMGVNFPEDRAALHFVPLVLLSIAFAIERLALEHRRVAWTSALLLLLPVRTVLTANLDHTLFWPEQSVPTRFIDRLAELRRASPRPLLIGAQHQLAMAWPVGVWLAGREAQPLQTVDFPNGPHDLRIVKGGFLGEASAGYHVIDSAKGPGLWLLERNRALEVNAITELWATERSTRAEFAELAHLPDSLLRTGSILVEVDVPLTITSSSPDVRLVLEVNDAEGGKVFYDAIAPLVLRPEWAGHRLHWAWGLPILPHAHRAIVYLYNPGRIAVSHGMARTVLSAIHG